jgi:hypothetical protein
MAGSGGNSSGPARGAGSSGEGDGAVLSSPTSSTNETSIGAVREPGSRVGAKPCASAARRATWPAAAIAKPAASARSISVPVLGC